MHRIFYILAAGVLSLGFIFPVSAHAATTVADLNTVQARLQELTRQLQELQRILAGMGNYQYNTNSTVTWCYRDYRLTSDCDNSYSSNDNLRRIDVDLFNDYARVRIEYTNGRRENLIVNADSESEVYEYLMDETGASRSRLVAITNFDDSNDDDDHDNNDADDIDRIYADIYSGDAHIRVEYEDDDTERFTVYNETNHDDIIEAVADELNIDEDDVEDLIRFSNSSSDNDEDVDRIRVTIDRDDDEARAVVYYEDDSTDEFDINTDNKSDIVSELADELDMDEDDIEDLISYTYGSV